MEYSTYKTKKTAMDKGNLKDAVSLMRQNLEPLKADFNVYNIKKFGRLLEVEAYFHEVDEYYRCVGFEIETETQFAFDNGEMTELTTDVGFYSIWIGKSHEAAPFTFEEGNGSLGRSHKFTNGLGDHAEVLKVIASKKEVQDISEKMLY